MIILGLTGSIGMGKSTAAKILQEIGIPVQDADIVVHDLMAKGGEAVDVIGDAFPGVINDGAVDRQALGAKVFGNEAKLKKLEAILHPMVRLKRNQFLSECADKGFDIAVLEVPLLFETNGHKKCDKTILISASYEVQKDRVLRRPGMSEAKLTSILERQMTDQEKRKRADYVIDSSFGTEPVLENLTKIVQSLENVKGKYWPDGYVDC